MAFTISLCTNLSEEIAVDKDIQVIQTVSGVLKNETSIIDPVIVIETDLAGLVRCNYLEIPAFQRGYFVRNIKSVRNNLVELTCHVDVLSSFKDAIRGNTAIIKRQENNWNLYLNDGSFKVYQNPLVLTKEFPSGFNTWSFVLGVAGKSRAPSS